MPGHSTARVSAVPWDNGMYVRAYVLARSGLGKKHICDSLGLNYKTFDTRLKRDEHLRAAIEAGREEIEGDGRITKSLWDVFVYKRLPPDIRPLWDQVREVELAGGSGWEKLELLLSKEGKRTRQLLWFHALVFSNFSRTDACRRTGIAHSEMTSWMSDPDFVKLFDAISDMQKDFIESSLMQLIAGGDSPATIFAAKTRLRDRGYDPKITVEHTGSVTHKHVDVTELFKYLSLGAKREIVAALEKVNQPALPGATGGVIDAEIINEAEEI